MADCSFSVLSEGALARKRLGVRKLPQRGWRVHIRNWEEDMSYFIGQKVAHSQIKIGSYYLILK